MACCSPGCTASGSGDFYCRECGEMNHAECPCACCRIEATCPSCGHHFVTLRD